jgi:lipopolysaccharide transport system permease protein
MTALWDYRNLIKKMAITDLKLKYKNSILGLLWSLLQPMMMFLILWFVFSNIFVNQAIAKYPLYLLLGIIAWGFLDKAVGQSILSIVGKPSLVKKIYFPREVLVISACLTALMMSAIEFIVFGLFMVAMSSLPTIAILTFPAILLIEFVLVLGASLAIASLNVRFRDIQWIWPVIMQAGFFMTPIIYSMDFFQGKPFAGILALNPMGIILNEMRDALIYDRLPQAADVAYISIIAFLMLIAGLAIFRKMEPTFAEEV